MIATYDDLKYYFERFHLGKMSKLELSFAIDIWQRSGARL